MANFIQEDRLLKIDTPLGKDEVMLIGLKGSEKVSSLSQIQT